MANLRLFRLWKAALSIGFILILGLASGADAHRTGERYIYLDIDERTVSGRLEVTLEHIAKALGDPDSDAGLSEETFDGYKDQIYDLFSRSLEISVDGERFDLSIIDHRFINVGFATFVSLDFQTAIDTPIPDEIIIHHIPVFETLAKEHGLEIPALMLVSSNVRSGLKDNKSRHTYVFGSQGEEFTLSTLKTKGFDIFKVFVGLGFKHILIGADHLVFLLALLLPAMLQLNARGQIVPAEKLGPVLKVLLTTVTFFTLGHALSLSLSALDIVRLPPDPVETAIAASVVGVAVMNIFFRPSHGYALIVGLLGLLHGLGFANVLSNNGLEPGNIGLSLFGFNLGIELGQVVFVTIFASLLYQIRRWKYYSVVVLKGGSLLIALIGFHWFIERGFGIDLPLRELFG
ncbi:MAG: HupE/UreJ family protein [Paracoccaceae bacterium]